MKVELLVDRATVAGLEPAGAEIDVTVAEAERLIAAGHARPVRRRKAETAVPAAAPERAVR